MSKVVSMGQTCAFFVSRAARHRRAGLYGEAMALLTKARDQFGPDEEIELKSTMKSAARRRRHARICGLSAREAGTRRSRCFTWRWAAHSAGISAVQKRITSSLPRSGRAKSRRRWHSC